MDMLEPSIAATCPLAFGGTTGSLFAKAVTTLIAAQCSIFDDYKWPNDNADDIIGSAPDLTSFDFIVVGAGTAGSVVASRLTSFNPSWSVLLIEAGNDPGLDSEIPAFLFFNQNAPVDWNYKTYPDGKSCLGFQNNSCIWSKGKTMGGSSSINAMLYIRGHPNDYDQWEESGNSGWSYQDLKPYFERIEDKLKLQDKKHQKNPWYDVIKSAWNELGHSFHEGYSNEVKIGTRITNTLISNGKRLNTAKVYLKDSKNLYIMKNTIVQKIIIDPDTKVATGVEIQHSSGVKMNLSASKEIILSAGSIATPQILILSGIGPKRHLTEKKINCLVDLPVGQNLQDHILLPFLLKINQHTTLSSETINSFFIEYMLTRTGPFSHIGIIDFMGFINTSNLTDYPDIQFHHTYFPQKDELMLKSYFQGVGYKDEIVQAIEKLNEDSDLLGIYPTLIHPKSKGEILLVNTDSKAFPIIKSNYFQHPDDISTLIKAIKFIQELEKTKSFNKLGIKVTTLTIPGCSELYPGTNAYWECYVRHIGTTLYHPVGTAKMGPKSDGTTVVNHNLLVHGVHKLRVVDASVIPSITGANTVAPTLVIAEKAADIIIKHYSPKFEL